MTAPPAPAATRLLLLWPLLALCALLPGTPARAQSGNAAAFVSQAVPPAMTAGQGYPVTVTMRNTGTTTWTDAGAYRLGSQSPPDNQTWGPGRALLPGPVAPGQSATFRFTATAPATPGAYAFQWRMVQDGVEWFGDFTPAASVAVSAAGAADFALSLGQPALTIAQGDSRGLPVAVTTTGGFAGPVTLSVSGLEQTAQEPDVDASMRGAFVPPTLTGGGASRLILTALVTNPPGDTFTPDPGTYQLTVTATAGGVTRSQPLTVTVTAAPQPTAAGMALTDAAKVAGFGLTTFASNFPTTSGIGPVGIAFPGPGAGPLVSDLPGHVRLFPTDADGQDAGAAAVAPDSYSQPAGLAMSGGLAYLCDLGGDVLPLDGSGHTVGPAISAPGATGIIADPLHGHLFVTGNYNIYDVDPGKGTASVWLQSARDANGVLNGLDGLTISGDGGVLYSLSGDDDVVGYNTTTKAKVFDLAALNPVAPVVQADGTALGSGSLAGKLYVNSNDGVVWQVDMTTGDCVQVAVGGTRGDFATPDPNNGSLLLTQSTTIMRLTPPSGGRFGQTPSAPLGLRAAPGNGQVALAWNPVPGATGYTLWRATTSTGPFLSVTANIPGAAWVDSGLTNGQTYSYVVAAANSFGAGPTSNVASATPDGGLPLPVNAAAFVSQSVPSSMSAGQVYPVTVTMRNTGTSVWTAAGLYLLGSQADQDNRRWGLGRVALPGTPPGAVQPGATAAFTFNVTAPSSPGVYPFQWRMVQEGVQWFGDFTPQVGVAVNPPSFQIANVSNGDALTGDVMMTVAINDPTPDHSMTPDPLSLQIDGAEVSLGHVDLPSATSSAETVTFDVHTPDYANGAHTITVTDNNTSSDTRTVSFANVIQTLSTSCMFDGGPFLVNATMDTPQPWQILIEDTSGNTLKTIQGSGSAISVSWDGMNDQGNPVPDGYYQAMITAGDLGTAAAPGAVVVPHGVVPPGKHPIRRCFPKAHRGDVLVVIDQDLLNNPLTGQSSIVEYPLYIESKLLPHVGGDFGSVPTFIEFSGKYSDPEIIREDVQEIQSILHGSILSFVYMLTHGEDYFQYSDGKGTHHSVPFFEIGKHDFYSVNPVLYGKEKRIGTLSDYVVADNVNQAYYNGDYSAPFVWMDTCCSAGSDGEGDVPKGFFSTDQSGITPDNSWADAFSINVLNGGFLGWMGVVPAYGQSKGAMPHPFDKKALGILGDGPAFDRFRKAIWEGMFTNRKYINGFFVSAHFDALNAGTSSNLDYVGARERGYYFGNPFLNFPSP